MVIIVPQPLVANLGPSTIPVTSQAILATATLEEQPIGPPVLGQGFESPVGQGSESLLGPVVPARSVPGWIELQLPQSDFIEPMEAVPAVPGPAAADAGQPAGPAPKGDETIAEIVLEPASVADWGKTPSSAILNLETEAPRHEEYPTFSLAAMIGTTAIATGGYQLLLGGSARFNQRWLPTRRSSSRRRNAVGV